MSPYRPYLRLRVKPSCQPNCKHSAALGDTGIRLHHFQQKTIKSQRDGWCHKQDEGKYQLGNCPSREIHGFKPIEEILVPWRGLKKNHPLKHGEVHITDSFIWYYLTCRYLIRMGSFSRKRSLVTDQKLMGKAVRRHGRSATMTTEGTNSEGRIKFKLARTLCKYPESGRCAYED